MHKQRPLSTAGIHINQGNLDRLPEEGVPEDLIHMVEVDSTEELQSVLDSPDVYSELDNIYSESNVQNDSVPDIYTPGAEHNGILNPTSIPDLSFLKRSSHNEEIDVGSQSTPLQRGSDAGWLSKSFVTLFPTGTGDVNISDRLRNVTLEKTFAHYLKIYRVCPLTQAIFFPYAEDKIFMFVCLNILEKKRVNSQAAHFLKITPEARDISVADLRSMFTDGSDPSLRKTFVRKLKTYSANFRGSNAYWLHKQNLLKNIVENSPSPDFFMSFYFADYYSSYIQIPFSCINTDSLRAQWPLPLQITDQKYFIGPLTPTQQDAPLIDRMRNAARAPHLAVSIFNLKMETMFTRWLEGLLNVDYYFARLEVQSRGSVHLPSALRLFSGSGGIIELSEKFLLSDSISRKFSCLVDFTPDFQIDSFDFTSISISHSDLFFEGLHAKLVVESFNDRFSSTLNPELSTPLRADRHPCMVPDVNYENYIQLLKKSNHILHVGKDTAIRLSLAQYLNKLEVY